MLDIAYVRAYPDDVRRLCVRRNCKVSVDDLLALDEQWRTRTTWLDRLRAERKSVRDHDLGRRLKADIGDLEARVAALAVQRDELLSWLPNKLAEDTPDGASDADNVPISHWGLNQRVAETHEVIAQRLGILDMMRGAKVVGSGFVYWRGDGARLLNGLYQIAIELLVDLGFELLMPPIVAAEETLFGSGYLPFAKEESYTVAGERFALIGTSEQTLIGFHRDDILARESLPLRYCAFTPCFRKEAGAAGKETRGAFRLHQFHKVEQIVFCEPEGSDRWLEHCLENAEMLMQKFDLPYRVVRVCVGDMGNAGFKKYDIEAWFAGFGEYRETHSLTDLGDYQTRRSKTRIKSVNAAANARYPHTISATMATERIFMALLEHNLQPDGSVMVPPALRPYIGGRDRITS